jgi:FkbM family methyltransferase
LIRAFTLSNPKAYPHLATAYWRHVRALVRQWPEMRAASAQWPRWALRRALLPILPVHLTLTSRTGVRCALGDDPADDSVFRHLHGYGSGLYFPAVPGGEPEGTILDVGAHHGIYAIEALRRYPRCDLIAIEPDPAACRQIDVNARLNGVASRVEIVCAGLAGADDRGWLLLEKDGSWASRTSSATPSRPSAQIELRTLDTVLAGRRPAIVKCNAEGAEFALVPQLIALDRKPRLIVLMVHPEAGAAEDLVGLLAGAGYEVRDADTPPRGLRFHCFPKQARSG